jgi:hypothetical protein
MDGVWQHFKGGYYVVDDEAIFTENNMPVVVYHAISNDGEHDRRETYVRSRHDWFAMVQTPEGKRQRFVYVGDHVPSALTGDEAK